jgi:Cu/Ag efflux protein CusF
MNQQRFFLRATGLALMVSAGALSPAWAASHQGGHSAHAEHAKPTAQAATDDMTDGEVRKVDKEGGKLTLKHADIKSLDMPAMTMVFVV